jgi:methylenetetrahydrofolate reductase (NADPH)
MSFARELATGHFPVALEITPPQHDRPRVLLRRASLLGGLASAINVIQRPDRQPSLDAALQLLAQDIEPAWHLVTRGRPRASIEHDLYRARDGGIGLILVILGDHEPAPAGDRGVAIREAVAMARQIVPAATVGATLNQYGSDMEAAFRNLWPKLAAGASYIQTQPVFDLACFESAAQRIRRDAPETRIVPMVMPLPTVEAADRIAGRLGVSIPRWVREVDPWRAFAEIVTWLRRSGLADGLAVMTFETDPPAEVGARIASVLVAAGIGAPAR